MEEKLFTISKHAKERYTERIMDKDNNNDIQRFIIENENKITSDITKMIQYGELIFSGKQVTKDGRGNYLDVYRQGLWIVLVDNKTNNVVTLYKVDLGVDDEFNKSYVDKMIEKINVSKENKETVLYETSKENDGYKNLIDSNIAQINEYKSYIKNLEELNMGYKTIIDNNSVKVNIANAEVSGLVNKLISSKEF